MFNEYRSRDYFDTIFINNLRHFFSNKKKISKNFFHFFKYRDYLYNSFIVINNWFIRSLFWSYSLRLIRDSNVKGEYFLGLDFSSLKFIILGVFRCYPISYICRVLWSRKGMLPAIMTEVILALNGLPLVLNVCTLVLYWKARQIEV